MATLMFGIESGIVSIMSTYYNTCITYFLYEPAFRRNSIYITLTVQELKTNKIGNTTFGQLNPLIVGIDIFV